MGFSAVIAFILGFVIGFGAGIILGMIKWELHVRERDDK